MERIPPILLVLIMLSSSCRDFLDEPPDDRVVLDNLEKASQLLVNGYSISSPNFTDWMSDDVQFTAGTTKRINHEELYKWEDVTTGPDEQDSPDHYWFETYNAIAHANEVLAVIETLPVNDEEDVAKKKAIEGEALLIRSYGHFMLVNLFAPFYNNDNLNAPGIPYITEPETEFLAKYERKSVREVYEHINEDLTKGLELIDDSYFLNSGKYHFTRNAALAFASRFYLYKRDEVRCLYYSNELLGSSPAAFIRDLTSSPYRLASASSTEYPNLYTSTDEPANLLLMRKISLVQRTDFAYGMDQSLYFSLYNSHPFGGANDLRRDLALVKGTNNVYPLRYQSLFERSSLNSNVGYPYYIHMAFTGEEVLFNRAEIKILQGDLEGALDDLQLFSERRYAAGEVQISFEALRSLYGVPEGDTSYDQRILFDYLINERRKEFLFQGMRWFDLKRFEIDVSHNLEDGSLIELSGDDLRWVLQIPESAQEVGGLEPNPR